MKKIAIIFKEYCQNFVFVSHSIYFLRKVAYVRQWFPSFRTVEAQRELYPILFEYDHLELDEKNEVTRKIIKYYFGDTGGALSLSKKNEMSQVRVFKLLKICGKCCNVKKLFYS